VRVPAFAKQLFHNWKHDAIANTAAALTYYGILALFPFLLFLVALASSMLDPHVISQVVAYAGRFAPAPVTHLLERQLESLMQRPSRSVLTLGILGALWAASGGVGALTDALNRCCGVEETRPLWKTRGLALLVTIGAGFVTIAASAVALLVPLWARRLPGALGASIAWLRFPVAGLLIMVTWALLYWLLPRRRPRFRILTPGSTVAVLVWLLASWGFAQYVRHSRSYAVTYGALGGVIILLIWMWISSMALLLGAEINKILDDGESRPPR
jgi:membrane protein